MKLQVWLTGLLAVASVATDAAPKQRSRALLEKSLNAQRSFRSLCGEYRSMYTNFAVEDDTPASDRAGRFTILRSRADGTVDRLFSREFDTLKGESGDSSSLYVNGESMIYLYPDGTGERSKASDIEYVSAVFCLRNMERCTQQMLDSTTTVQLPDTVIDDRSCYLFALHTISRKEGYVSESWYRLAIESQNLLPIWLATRGRNTGSFNADQSGIMELHRLQVDRTVDTALFEAPRFREPRTTAQGSCNVGEMAPVWNALPDATTGRLYSLDSLLGAGNVVVMDWSTSTCGACIMAMPTMDSLYRNYRTTGTKVAFVMMNHGDSQKQALGLIERQKIEYPVLLCPKSTADAYGLHAYPVFLVVDRNGRVVLNQGGFGGNADMLSKALTDAIDGALIEDASENASEH